METTRPPGFPGNPPARMPRAPTPARSPPPRPLRRGEMTFRPTHDVGPRTQCISGLNHAAYGLPVNASRPGSPQAHASLGSGWRPTLAGWDWIPTGFRTRFRRSHHGILSPLTGLSRHTRWCTNRDWPARCQPTGSSPADAIRHGSAEGGHPIEDLTAEDDLTPLPSWAPGAKALSDDGRVSEVLKGIRVFLVPGVPGHRVRPRWRDDVHAAIERAVAFLLCVHCERRLAFDNCFAYHGRRSSWVDSSGSGPGVRPKGRGWPRHILGETRAEPIRLCRKRSFTTYRNPHGVGWLAPPARYHSCTTSSEEPPRSTVSGTSREWRFDWARFV